MSEDQQDMSADQQDMSEEQQDMSEDQQDMSEDRQCRSRLAGRQMTGWPEDGAGQWQQKKRERKK